MWPYNCRILVETCILSFMQQEQEINLIPAKKDVAIFHLNPWKNRVHPHGRSAGVHAEQPHITAEKVKFSMSCTIYIYIYNYVLEVVIY